jgi:hypothetical protein
LGRDKPFYKGLYKDGRKPLKEVIAIIDEAHHFLATERALYLVKVW